jgi:Mn-dependent DtxR family transcriptional regulator
MTKLGALQYLQQQGITEGDAGYAVANKLAEKTKLAKKGEVKVKATGVKSSAKVAEAA